MLIEGHIQNIKNLYAKLAVLFLLINVKWM